MRFTSALLTSSALLAGGTLACSVCADDHDHDSQGLSVGQDAADSTDSSDLVRTQPLFAASENKPLLDGYTYPIVSASTDSDLDQDLDPIPDSERISASHLSALLGMDVAQFFPSPVPSVFFLNDNVSLQLRRFPSEAGMKSLETALASASAVSGAIVAVAVALPSDPAERSALVTSMTERVGEEGGFAKQSIVLSSLLEAVTATNVVGAKSMGNGKKGVEEGGEEKASKNGEEKGEQEEKETAGDDDSGAGVNRGQAVAALFVVATVSGFIGWLW